MTVFLVRHGESHWNRAGLVQGQADAPGLTTLGVAQALGAAARLRAAVSAPGRVELVSSDLRRAVETARVILGAGVGAAVRIDPSLRERRLGVAEGRPPADVAGLLGVAQGRVVDPDAAPPGGESVQALLARVTEALGRLAAGPGRPDTVVVAHGGVIRAALALAAGERPEAMAWRQVPNGSVVELDLAAGEVQAVGPALPR